MPLRWDQGNCTSKDRNDLAFGQLVQSTGGYYGPGDPVRLRKLGGRSTFGTLAGGAAVKGLALCQFDTGGKDRLVGLTGTSLLAATPGATGTFADTLATGLNASTADLSATHYANKWFLATGYDRNRVLESNHATTGTTAVTLTYVEGGASADTITRAAGSFVTDGFVAGQRITVSGTSLNNGTYTLATVAALTLTLSTADDLAAEVIASTITSFGTFRFMGMIAPQQQVQGVPSTGVASLVRATEDADTSTGTAWTNGGLARDGTTATSGSLSLVYASTNTITRAAGSFLTDGFLIGHKIQVAGTIANNGAWTISNVTALVITVVTGFRQIIGETATSTVTLIAGGVDTYAAASLSVVVAGSSIHTWGWRAASSDTQGGRILNITWGLAGNQNGVQGNTPGTGGTVDLGATVNILIEYSTDWNGTTGTFTTIVSENNVTSASLDKRTAQVPLTTAINTTAVAVRATFTYLAGSSTVTMRVYDLKVATAGVAAFTTTTGFFYGVTEWDSVRQLESPLSPVSALIHFNSTDTPSSANLVTISLPTAALNTTATHWRVYRTTDGGPAPDQMYLIGDTAITQIQYVDDFSVYGPTVLGNHFYAMVSVTVEEGSIRYPRDTPPPRFDFITYYRGSVVGFTHDKPRTLFYSFAGRPESFPELYVLENFPFPERDVLLAAAPCGDSLIIAGRELMMAIDDLPRAGNQGTFNAVDIRPIRGQPGAVSQNAMCGYSVYGEPRVAWVSKYGVHETNGTTSRKLSGNMAWPPALTQALLSTSVLFYDANIQCLVFAYDSGGTNAPDRFALFHMAPEQQGEDGFPKWTGPHYGKINRQTAGIVAGTYRRWSGHPTNGIVYVENDAIGTDSSLSYALAAANSGAVSFTYNDNGASADTITRAAGSFVSDGFAPGARLTVSGTVSNNGSYIIATVAALTITLIPSDVLTQETVSSTLIQTGTDWPFIAQTGRIYAPDNRDWAVYKASFRYSDWQGDTLYVSWVSGRDATTRTQTKSKTITATNQQGSDIFVGLMGEWQQIQVTHNQTGFTGKLLDTRYDAHEGARSGRVA